MANLIAIIGLAGRLPGAPALDALGRNLRDGGGPAAAGIGREPWVSRGRLLGEQAARALEDSGHAARLDVDRTGLFAGGDEGDNLAADVAGELGLRGPAVTAGGSALAATALACRSLRCGECDLALAGEASIEGDGAGVVVLRRLPRAIADGDRILAVIRPPEDHQPAGELVVGPLPSPCPDAGEMVGESGAIRERPVLANTYTPPGNHLEAAIARLWQEQLGIDRVGVDDNFFELGGTSIAGVKIIALLKGWLHQDIPTVSLYEGPTVRALTKVLLESGPPKGYDSVRERGERRRRKLQRLGYGAAQDAAE